MFKYPILNVQNQPLKTPAQTGFSPCVIDWFMVIDVVEFALYHHLLLLPITATTTSTENTTKKSSNNEQQVNVTRLAWTQNTAEVKIFFPKQLAKAVCVWFERNGSECSSV